MNFRTSAFPPPLSEVDVKGILICELLLEVLDLLMISMGNIPTDVNIGCLWLYAHSRTYSHIEGVCQGPRHQSVNTFINVHTQTPNMENS